MTTKPKLTRREKFLLQKFVTGYTAECQFRRYTAHLKPPAGSNPLTSKTIAVRSDTLSRLARLGLLRETQDKSPVYGVSGRFCWVLMPARTLELK